MIKSYRILNRCTRIRYRHNRCSGSKSNRFVLSEENLSSFSENEKSPKIQDLEDFSIFNAENLEALNKKILRNSPNFDAKKVHYFGDQEFQSESDIIMQSAKGMDI